MTTVLKFIIRIRKNGYLWIPTVQDITRLGTSPLQNLLLKHTLHHKYFFLVSFWPKIGLSCPCCNEGLLAYQSLIILMLVLKVDMARMVVRPMLSIDSPRTLSINELAIWNMNELFIDQFAKDHFEMIFENLPIWIKKDFLLRKLSSGKKFSHQK